MSNVIHLVHHPEGLLANYVREILCIESKHPRTQLLMPETGFTLALRQSGAVSISGRNLPDAVLSGLQAQTRAAEHSANSSMIVVRFRSAGIAPILRDRADLFFGQSVSLDSVFPPQEVERLQNRIADAHAASDRIAVVERFLASRIAPRDSRAHQIDRAARIVYESGGQASIKAIARRVAMSQSALERHFRAATGVSPKMLARLARLHHVCLLWKRGLSLTRIAAEAGYSDQPHLVRDFRSFTGRAPLEFFRKSPPYNLPTFYK